ncbi:MAG: hypothetical protein IPL32_01265 [Chloracidobacterium sp.]|nr:hypothetical protein [Chloracidobacterium sp.]
MKIFIRPIFFAIIVGLGSTAAFAQNYKIKQTTSMSGHNMESTVYVKGSRKRTENGGMMGMTNDVATIEQCDLKRTVQVNDKKKLYYVDSTAVSEPSAAPVGKTPVTAGKATKGGTVTHTSSITDTGERKQMFGLIARHIKTSMTVVSSPDACSKQDMKIETDGWYVDLPLFSCPFTPGPRSPMAPESPQPRGCEDRIITKSTGTGKLGFALQMTQTISTGGRGEAFTTSTETIEFSKATLDDALFNVPTNYTLASSSQALYGTPDYSAVMKGGGNDDDDLPKTSSSNNDPSSAYKSAAPGPKKAGVKRIGVLAPSNRTNEIVSTTNLQAYLIRQLTVGNVEAVAVNSEADAKALNCDYILTSDISKLKQSTASKIGGLFGKVTNTDSSASRNYESQVDFKLILLTSSQSVLQSKAAAKIVGDADMAAQGVLAQEATAILAVAK